MALWEYKVITSGKGGFASPTMLESYLNQLGRDEWEIVDFRSDPNNLLVFNGLARRPTQREWTLEAAVAAAAKAEADKIRAELMQRQHAGDAGASADAPAGSTAGEKAAGPDGLRQLRDTERDNDPEALADEASHADEWSDEAFEDDLPVFFDAIKPHLRKNPNTPGQSVALNYLAKRWEQPETDLHGALVECGFVIPETETDAPVYLEYEGDLYWIEKNNRGQFFLNTREKPRPKFRVTAGKPLDPADPAYQALAEEQAALEAERAKRAAEQAAREAEAAARRAERDAQRQAAEQARREQQAAAQAAREAARAAAAANGGSPSADGQAPAPGTNGAPGADGAAPVEGGFAAAPAPGAPAIEPGTLPAGEALLDAIRPQMRRNRRGPGYSGSSSYLAKHFKVEETVLKEALHALGLIPAEGPGARGEPKLIGEFVYWVNKDNNGGYWINGREATPRDRAPAASAPAGGAFATGSAPAATAEAVSGLQGAPGVVDQAAVGAALPPPEAGAPSTAGEPAIFRPVPRGMPPVPAASAPAVPAVEAASSPGPEPASVDSASAVPAAPAPEAAAAVDASVTPAPAVSASEPVTIDAEAAQAKPLTALRLLMKSNRSRSGVSGSLSFLAEAVGRGEGELVEALVKQGLVVPPAVGEGEEEAKPTFVEHDGEIFWLNRYAKDGSLWLNAKPARSAARRGAAAKDSVGGSASADEGDASATPGEEKPARGGSRPRTKRRSASAIEADAAAEE